MQFAWMRVTTGDFCDCAFMLCRTRFVSDILQGRGCISYWRFRRSIDCCDGVLCLVDGIVSCCRSDVAGGLESGLAVGGVGRRVDRGRCFSHRFCIGTK